MKGDKHMEIGSILRESRINAKMSVAQVSNILTKCGYKASQKTVYSWENGNSRPDIEILMKLCDIYAIKDILKTFGYDGYKEDGSIQLNINEIDLVEKYRTLDPHGKDMVDTVLNKEAERVAELESTPATVIDIQSHRKDGTRLVEYFHSASAGTGVFILGNETTDQLSIPATPENRKVDYAIKVSGDSMEPDYHDGEIVLVSQKVEMNIGDVGIFIINNKAYIKEYGETELISRNPGADNITIAEYDNIVCMGKVIGKYEI